MRKSLAVLAILVLLSGQAFSSDWPSLRPRSSCSACVGSTTDPKFPGYSAGEESPLYPELSKWTFQRSPCKQGRCSPDSKMSKAPKETPFFPPLPYSNRSLFPAPGYAQPQAAVFGGQ